jgi:hypothetical protein
MVNASTYRHLLDLPADQRAGIADLLIESLDSGAEGDFQDAWVSEVVGRVESLRAGELATQDAFEALVALEQKLPRRA